MPSKELPSSYNLDLLSDEKVPRLGPAEVRKERRRMMRGIEEVMVPFLRRLEHQARIPKDDIRLD